MLHNAAMVAVDCNDRKLSTRVAQPARFICRPDDSVTFTRRNLSIVGHDLISIETAFRLHIRGGQHPPCDWCSPFWTRVNPIPMSVVEDFCPLSPLGFVVGKGVAARPLALIRSGTSRPQLIALARKPAS